MNFHDLVQYVLHDTVAVSLGAFRPELVLCAAIVVLLLAKMIAPGWKAGAFYVMLAATAAAFYLVIPWQLSGGDTAIERTPIFTKMLVVDGFSIYMRSLLMLFALLFTTFTWVAGVPDREDATDFYALALGALLGMCLMVSANHMLIVLLGVEMASVPSYVLAGMLRHRRQSSEAALKYAVFGAGTAGVMLYGISLLVGVLGSAHLPTMAAQLADVLQTPGNADRHMVLALGGLMVMVGLAFKLSAVPFHFWAPDVFEGAPAEVGAFLSIASKAAALALLVRLALGFSQVDPALESAYQQRATAAVTQVSRGAAEPTGAPGARRGSPDPADPGAAGASLRSAPATHSPRTLLKVLDPARQYLTGLLALLAAVTCTFGNLAAYGQTNMKRLLAYSTIAHAGYMMMPVAAAVALAGNDPAGARAAVAALAFYAGIYLFMNLGAFAAVAFLRNVLGSEEIADYAGLMRRSPALAVCLSITLFSLVGLPPLAGFSAKFTVFASLFDARLIVLLVIGGLNTVLSLFYYLRVVKVMILAAETEGRPAPQIPLASVPGAFCALAALPLVVLGLWWNGLFHWAQVASSALLF